MRDAVERLEFMRSHGCQSIRQLMVVLALGQAGGVLAFADLQKSAGYSLASTLREDLARIAENLGNGEGSLEISKDGSTVTLTQQGREACAVWNTPLNPLTAWEIPPAPATPEEL